MNIDRLEEFVVLADCLNFSKAANQLYMTQPVLSRHINELEDYFQAKFFIRDTHKTALTPLGELAVNEFRKVLDAHNEALQNIRHACEQENETLSFGFLGLAVQPFIRQFVSQFSEEHPSIQVNYSVAHLMELMQAIHSNQHDLVLITDLIPSLDKDLEQMPLANDPLYVCLPYGDPLSKKDSVTITELSGHPMIAFDQKYNPHTFHFHQQLFKDHHAEFNVVKTISNIDSALFQVQFGTGAFIIPRHLLSFANDAQTVLISDPDVSAQLTLVWKKNNQKPAVQTFIRAFSSFFSDAELI
jgi:DNA-binding transcriptional LysR family regulator